jgi:pimeloyl-ACP methyl ester carboxylesterase
MERTARVEDWVFSWDYLYGRRPDVEARVDRFAEALVARSRDAAVDEIVVVGHSMGSTLAVEVVARALEIDPKLGRHGPAVCLLTVGSTIPKFALHPAGERFRRHAAQIVAEPAIAWAEYQARSDLISFYKFDPVKLARFYGDPRRQAAHAAGVDSGHAHSADLLAHSAEVHAHASSIRDGE